MSNMKRLLDQMLHEVRFLVAHRWDQADAIRAVAGKYDVLPEDLALYILGM